MSSFATVAGKSINGKFTAKIDFPIAYFTLPLLMLDLDHMLVKFERNRMVPTIQNFEAFGKKGLTIFDSVNAILKDVTVTETIV